MINISQELKSRLISLGVMNHNGILLTPLQTLEKGACYFYLNKKEYPYTHDNGNINALCMNYQEYIIFSNYLKKKYNLNLDLIFCEKNYFIFQDTNLINSIGFDMCNIELTSDCKYISDDDREKYEIEKKIFLEKISNS